VTTGGAVKREKAPGSHMENRGPVACDRRVIRYIRARRRPPRSRVRAVAEGDIRMHMLAVARMNPFRR
jgi:hypothetical protein